jgi:prephenate dehydratase
MTGPAARAGNRGGPLDPSVAFQGEYGAFSEEAILHHFGGSARPLPRRAFPDVGDAVRRGEADLGLLPVENTLAGSVQGSHDVLAEGGLMIVGEVILPIRHFLMGIAGSREAELCRIISHPVALAQCTRYLRSRPDVEAVAVHDTAGAALEVARRGAPEVGAIASRGAAERYGLEILASDLQDRDDNQTRFYLVRREGEPWDHSVGPRDRPFRTVVMLELQDRPGALVEVLRPFAERGVDLSRIESRPAGDPWCYRFLLELRARAEEPRTQAALAESKAATTAFRILGSFPGATTR